MNNPIKRLLPIATFCILSVLFITAFTGANDKELQSLPESDFISDDTLVNERLKNTLPPGGALVNGNPVGKNWVNLIATLEEWNFDPQYWSLNQGVLHGDYPGGKLHNFTWTKKRYTNFELQAVVKLDGDHPNSGVCIRLHPVDVDNVPGYQIDMGAGYWASLWEEKRAGMVQKFPEDLAAKLVKNKDWNHYYIIAKDHHIQAWLNGVKTIDTVHVAGFEEGAIGFQLCHGNAHTILDVKSLFIKEGK